MIRPSSRSLVLAVLAASLGCGEDPPRATTAPAVATRTPTPPLTPVEVSRRTFPIDVAASRIGFTGRKVTDSHSGTFGRFEGAIDWAETGAEASAIRITVYIDSLAIEPARLQGHLLSPDLLDATAYPTASFQSMSVRPGGEGGATHTITGDLTLHGTTRSITFPATLRVTDAAIDATAEFSIRRQDFGIVYPGMPDDLIRDDVPLTLSLHAPRAR